MAGFSAELRKRWVGFGMNKGDLLPGIKLGFFIVSWWRGHLGGAIAEKIASTVQKVRGRL